MTRRVDHLVMPVQDLDATASGFSRAGFIVTPRADHPFGTSNRLVVFDVTYLELVAVTRPEAIPPHGFAHDVREFLGREGEGISHLVMGSDDATADHRELNSHGLAVGPVFDFSRPAPLADGTTVEARFSLVFTPPTDAVGCFLCVHHTPDAIWHESHLTHPNGATRLDVIEIPGRPPHAVEVVGPLDNVEWGVAQPSLHTDGSHADIVIGSLRIVGRSLD